MSTDYASVKVSGAAGERFGQNMVFDDGRLIVGLPTAQGTQQFAEGELATINELGSATPRIDRVPAPFEADRGGALTAFGASVAVIPDIGQCNSSSASPGATCAGTSVSEIDTPDGIADILVGAPGGGPRANGFDQGRVYVLDGKTLAIIKRIQLSASDQDAGGVPEFGAEVASVQGVPPCFGGSGGVTPCAFASDTAIARGDITADGKPELLIGAPGYNDVDCTGACTQAGRVFVVKSQDLAGVSPTTPVTTVDSMPNPRAQDDLASDPAAFYPERMGESIVPLGDVGSCSIPANANVGRLCTDPATPSSQPDGVPDFAVSADRVDLAGAPDGGVVFVIDGQSRTVLRELDQPTPQESGLFGQDFAGAAPIGDVAGSELPDVFAAATGSGAGAGRGFVFDGNVAAGATVLANLDDPTPASNGAFGISFAALGDAAGFDAKNEVAVGGTGDGGPGDVSIFSPCNGALVKTIADPDQTSGGEFGRAIAPIGDVNGDGLLDLAIAAPGTNTNAGSVYVMRSSGPALSFNGCLPPDTGGGGGGGGVGGGTGSSTGGQASGGSGSGGRSGATLARRTLKLSLVRKPVKIGKLVKIRGRLKAVSKRRFCQARVKVAVDRFEPAKFYLTVDVAITKKDGSFSFVTRPPRTTYYRVHVNQTKRCQGATSKRIKVKASS